MCISVKNVEPSYMQPFLQTPYCSFSYVTSSLPNLDKVRRKCAPFMGDMARPTTKQELSYASLF